MKKRTLITAALPYANGPLHLGHLVGYVRADIHARFLKQSGHETVFVCGDDTHGTPIEINAAQEGKTPEAFVAQHYDEHAQDFAAFLIGFDSYSSTNTAENKAYSDLFFQEHKKRGYIYEQDVEQTYCEHCTRFLPDRYVKGACPKCGADEQYGDQCEKCNAAYKTTDLVKPHCSICRSTPVRKSSTHYFFKLSAFSQELERWLVHNRYLQSEVKNFVLNWIKEGLHDWDITRDGPYFGFTIPGETTKYYYVWYDAPIGYIASTAVYCNNTCAVDDYWKNPETSIIHFIGKDITYHHFLFWQAMLMGAGFPPSESLVVNGHITINGEKMSKSRGTFITVRAYLAMQPPEFLRFHYAASLGQGMRDFDLDENDFRSRINNDLIANIANFAYRVLSFANNNFDSKLAKIREPAEVLTRFEKKFGQVKQQYELLNHREAMRLILEISAQGNKYFQEHEPWQMIRTDKKRCHEVVTFSANLVRNIAILLAPVMPRYAVQLQKQLGLTDQNMQHTGFDLQQATINRARIIFAKIEGKALPIVTSHEFPLDLRVAVVREVKEHPDADKLFILQVDMGGEQRQLVAGLREHYTAEELTGKHIVVIANLKPAKLRGEKSEGMLLAADDGKEVKVLEAADAQPGDAVRITGLPNAKKRIEYEAFSRVNLTVRNGTAVHNNKPLRAGGHEVRVAISDGARIR